MTAKRFFRVRVDVDATHWAVVARDVEHCKQILREIGMQWETDERVPDQPTYVCVAIDDAIRLGIAEITEYSPERLAEIKRCHTEDERGVIPLTDARLGDAFCSEW